MPASTSASASRSSRSRWSRHSDLAQRLPARLSIASIRGKCGAQAVRRPSGRKSRTPHRGQPSERRASIPRTSGGVRCSTAPSAGIHTGIGSCSGRDRHPRRVLDLAAIARHRVVGAHHECRLPAAVPARPTVQRQMAVPVGRFAGRRLRWLRRARIRRGRGGGRLALRQSRAAHDYHEICDHLIRPSSRAASSRSYCRALAFKRGLDKVPKPQIQSGLSGSLIDGINVQVIRLPSPGPPSDDTLKLVRSGVAGGSPL